jgi:GDP-L-fucose synthase
MAAASLHVMQLPKALYDQHAQPMRSHINVGNGSDVTIADLAYHVAQTIGYKGQITFDSSNSDGAPCKLMDRTRLNALGWMPMIDLQKGLVTTYQEFVSQHV